ncbi:hypothetical protein BAE44_0015322, partial [Dichanthelium oligosanthes]
LERNPWILFIMLTTAVSSTMVLLLVWDILFGFVAPEFWVKVPGVEGLDRLSVDDDAVALPPTFNITLRVNNWRCTCGCMR